MGEPENPPQRSKLPSSWLLHPQWGFIVVVIFPPCSDAYQQLISVLFAVFAFSWPLYSQRPIHLSDVHVVCASKIYTANENFETAECFAYSTSTGLFLAVGKREHILKEHANVPIRQLPENMAILPGLYDSHGHIMHVQSVFVEGH